MAVTVLTTWPKRRLGRRAWHLVHLLSIPAAVLAAVHAYQLGSDARRPLYLGLSALAVGLVTYPLVLRITGVLQRRAEARRGSEPLAVDGRELVDA